MAAILGLLLTLFGTGSAKTAFAQEPILRADFIFRDLSYQDALPVFGFDLQGVHVQMGDEPGFFPWHTIRSVSSDQSVEAFDEMHSELAAPMYRLRRLIDHSDFQGAAAEATALRPSIERLSALSATPPESFWPDGRKPFALSTFEVIRIARILGMTRGSQGDHDRAVVDYFELLSQWRNQPAEHRELSAAAACKLGLTIDVQTGRCQQLIPVFFDSNVCRDSLSRILNLPGVDDEREDRLPFEKLYLASLITTAQADGLPLETGSRDTSELLDSFTADLAGDPAQIWALVSATPDQSEKIKMLRGAISDTIDRSKQPQLWYAAVFRLARCDIERLNRQRLSDENVADLSEEYDAALLSLLSIPAQNDRSNDAIAAASLQLAASTLNQLGRTHEADLITAELQMRYAHCPANSNFSKTDDSTINEF